MWILFVFLFSIQNGPGPGVYFIPFFGGMFGILLNLANIPYIVGLGHYGFSLF